ncbi:hypothetical protein [Streptomyces sp. CC228A]|nr:hypothetical protein [Streptomyces sp. CC228A]
MAAFQRGIALAEAMPAPDPPAGPGAAPETRPTPWRHDARPEE